MELRNQLLRRADLVPVKGRLHEKRRNARAASRRRGVEAPEHAWKLSAREPGDPEDPLGRSTTLPHRSRPRRHTRRAARSGRTRRLPNSRRERLRGVGRSHSTQEAGEQRQPDGGRGVWGGKGIDRGERRPAGHGPDAAPGHRVDRTGRRTGGNRFAVTHPRYEPYEVVPHVRICAGGGPKGPSLPRPNHRRQWGFGPRAELYGSRVSKSRSQKSKRTGVGKLC
jgi:hypothetical protein